MHFFLALGIVHLLELVKENFRNFQKSIYMIIFLSIICSTNIDINLRRKKNSFQEKLRKIKQHKKICSLSISTKHNIKVRGNAF